VISAIPLWHQSEEIDAGGVILLIWEAVRSNETCVLGNSRKSNKRACQGNNIY